jgi:hypothetical protein
MNYYSRFCKQADHEHKRSKRQYAHTYHHEDVICLSEAFQDLPVQHYWAIFAHEIGHLIAGYEGDERAANRAANKHFKIKILYRDSKFGKRLEVVSKKDAIKIENHIHKKI